MPRNVARRGQKSIGEVSMCPAMAEVTDRFLGHYKGQTEENTNTMDKKRERFKPKSKPLSWLGRISIRLRCHSRRQVLPGRLVQSAQPSQQTFHRCSLLLLLTCY